MELEEEIAAKIREVDGNHTMGASALSTALMPLVKRAQAEARAAELRDIADEFVDQAFMGWPHHVDVREAAEHFEGMALKRADRIESEVPGV